MSEKEKEILAKLCSTIPKLSKYNQGVVLGVAEGMALMADMSKAEEAKKEEVCAGS